MIRIKFSKILRTNDISGLDEYLKTHNIDEEINGQTPLYWAVHENNLLFTQILIQKGAGINKKDALGRTPLLIACYFGFYDITKFLLEHGAALDRSYFDIANRGWDGHVQTEILELLEIYKQ